MLEHIPEAAHAMLHHLLKLQRIIRDQVLAACETQALDVLSGVSAVDECDTIYEIDRVGEEAILGFIQEKIAPIGPVLVVAEGLPTEGVIIRQPGSHDDPAFRIIMDPIDGTRGIMYQKRSAWTMAAIARETGPETSLANVLVAAQTEIPLVTQHLSDCVWGDASGSVSVERHDRIAGTTKDITIRPSGATTVRHGFATISRFFPGAHSFLAKMDDDLARAIVGKENAGQALYFEDQYICTGGQLYQLMSGRDRFVADLRPMTEDVMRAAGSPLGIHVHPYDICTELLARNLGVLIEQPDGTPLDAPLDLLSPVSWTGYANRAIRDEVRPHLLRLIEARQPPP